MVDAYDVAVMAAWYDAHGSTPAFTCVRARSNEDVLTAIPGWMNPLLDVTWRTVGAG